MTKETIKRHLISLFITFIATFLLVIAFEFKSDDFIFSVDAIRIVILSGIVAGARAVFKLIYEIVLSYVSSRLPLKKQ